jgi:hypothetical protein
MPPVGTAGGYRVRWARGSHQTADNEKTAMAPADIFAQSDDSGAFNILHVQ